MKGFAVAAASAALLIGSIGGALAQGTMPAGTSGSTMPMAPASSHYSGSIDTAGASYTHALNLLEANGYTGIENFQKNGQEFTASAMHDGKRVQVAVDPSGHIRNEG